MKIYNIPVNYHSSKNYEVKAENLEEAIKQALKTFLSEPDENYLQDSFEIDRIVEDEYQDESYDYLKILNEI